MKNYFPKNGTKKMPHLLKEGDMYEKRSRIMDRS
jgi:hypothetical protein